MSQRVKLDDIAPQILTEEVERAVEQRLDGRVEYTRRIEDPRELESRLRREEADAKYDRILRFLLNILSVLALFAVLAICSYVSFGPFTLDEKRLAQPILAAAVGAIGGYVFAKTNK